MFPLAARSFLSFIRRRSARPSLSRRGCRLTFDVLEAREVPAAYTLQLLHYYGESGLLGVQTAPILGALIDKFDDQFSNTLVLGEGDSHIPGPWLVGGADPSLNAVVGIGTTALGRPDIAIMNAFGTTASALGNHEFDLGSPVLQGAIQSSGAWVGAQFPLITANLDFSADSSLRGLADATLGGTATNAFAGKETNTIKGKIAPYAVVTKGGEKIGLVGATTYDLLIKSSPNGTVPKDDGNPATDDLQEVAAYIQASVDALRAAGVNKIVMVDQLDTIERNKLLAPMVNGIDVMVAGGGHERMGDATDTPVGFNGHTADFIPDAYPILTAGSDGKPMLIVTTDTEYTYLGRLVVGFDANGDIDISTLNPAINGAYASTEANLQAAYGTTDSAATIITGSTIGSSVRNIVNAINNVIAAKDGTLWGYTNVYLEGDRAFGRTQEVNLGDITADANLYAAQQAVGSGIFTSLKNGGGIRASIGSIDEDGSKIPPIANPSASKPAGAISTLDIENALRFNNKLMVFDTTPQGLKNILEFAAGLSSGPTNQSGGYMQIGGVHVSYDPTKPAGQKVQNVGLYSLDGDFIARVVNNGVVLADAPALISMACINFTANGGDGYPIKANADNFRFLLNDSTLSAPVDKSLDFTAAANVPANVLGEQKAFQNFLQAFHSTPANAYSVADTPASQDKRIQILNQKPQDTVLPSLTLGNKVTSLSEDTSTASRIKVADITVIDDEPANNFIYLSGADAASFEVQGNALYLKAGTVLNFEVKPSYAVTVNLDDGVVRSTPDGTDSFSLTVTDGANTKPAVFVGSDPLHPGSSALYVVGTRYDDEIEIESKSNKFEVEVHGRGGNLERRFTGPFSRIVVYGLGGNDHIEGDKKSTVETWMYGGDGKDHLEGGGGWNVLLGGAGDDHIEGGGLGDVLIGGTGADHLIGGCGDDILIGGTTDYDLDHAALAAILQKWNAGGVDFNARVASLQDPSFAYRLTSATVNDDGARDQLKRGKGRDRLGRILLADRRIVDAK
jgi:2',3'-cyclic-nucleotide 2'-phosphodiesterase (5'-nucleotidase family)